MQHGKFSVEINMGNSEKLMDSNFEIINDILTYRLNHTDITRILGNFSRQHQENFNNTIAELLTRIISILDVSNQLSGDMSLDDILMRMIKITTEAISAERGSLFLNDQDTNELFLRITQDNTSKEIRFPNNTGIAGSVFTMEEAIIIDDAYADDRFNKEIDRQTGYITRNIICVPIKIRNEKTIGVIQLLNKSEGNFTVDDLKLLEAITSQAATTLQNAQLYEQVQRARDEQTQLLEVTTAISSELQLTPLLQKIMETITTILHADRSTLFLYDEKTRELWSQVALGLENREIRFPSHIGIAGEAFTAGKTINIPDAYSDVRFNPEVDKRTGYLTKSMLCMPVRNKSGKSIGVAQVLNKKGGPFSKTDESKLRAFSSQASIAIENAKLFDEVLNMKNYNESVLESLKDGVITLGAKNIIEKCNSAALTVLNASEEDIIGKYAEEYFSEENRWLLNRIQTVFETEKIDISMDTELILADKSAVSVNMNIVPLLNTKKELIGTMLVIEDITGEKRLKGTLARYMTKEVAEKLMNSETLLGGQVQKATILFSDIRSFTTISEKIGAQETVSMLNEYFTIMVDIIFRHGGILDKYIGDAIMSVFGTPFSTGEDADRAVMTAIDMLTSLKDFNIIRLKEGKEAINIGVGINTGDIVVGNIGSLKRMDYTVIGDGVNIASRLEGANKHYGTSILLSEFTSKELKYEYILREVDLIQVKGKYKPVSICEVLNYHDEKTFPNLPQVLQLYNDGLDYYKAMNWKKGIDLFEKAFMLNPYDRLLDVYINRCHYFINNPPEDNWNGVWVMEEK
jgi:adenylate cyclase